VFSRAFYEQRHSAAEDEGLIGLLNLLTSVIKHDASFKQSPDAKVGAVGVVIPLCFVMFRLCSVCLYMLK